MSSDTSLSRRIVIAFTLMTTAVASLFAFGIVLAIQAAEIDLVSTEMNRQLDFILAAERDGAVPHLGPDAHLYRSTPGGAALPDWLRAFPTGFSEVEHDGLYRHLLIRDDGDRRFALLHDQDEFESREQMLFAIVGAGWTLSVLAALAIGTLTARRVIAPVIRLAGQVRHRDQLLPLAPPLAPDYANDEVGQLAAAFDDTLGRLRAALDRERLFTSDVSHELRTPLMVIASSCELLLETLPADGREHRQIVRTLRSCEEMRELVETFLWLARGTDSTPHGQADAPLADVAAEQLQRWLPDAHARGLGLRLEHEAADDGRYPAPLLRAVISNLLRNALHYTDRGEIRLTLRARGFSVYDTGVGIPEAERHQVFQPFVRGGSGRGDGIGIGLSLVQRICARQSWQVTLHENPGGGCEFRVALAAARADEAP